MIHFKRESSIHISAKNCEFKSIFDSLNHELCRPYSPFARTPPAALHVHVFEALNLVRKAKILLTPSRTTPGTVTPRTDPGSYRSVFLQTATLGLNLLKCDQIFKVRYLPTSRLHSSILLPHLHPCTSEEPHAVEPKEVEPLPDEHTDAVGLADIANIYQNRSKHFNLFQIISEDMYFCIIEVLCWFPFVGCVRWL